MWQPCRRRGKAPKACWRKVRRLDEIFDADDSFSLKWVFRGSLNVQITQRCVFWIANAFLLIGFLHTGQYMNPSGKFL